MRSNLVSFVNKLILLIVGVSLLVWPLSSQASFPGTNGRIYYPAPGSESNSSVIKSKKADGSDEQIVINQPADTYATQPELSPDGKKLLYILEDNTNDKIMVANGDGSSPVSILTLDSASYYIFNPSWSPDSTKIVFISGETVPGGSSGVHIINVDGSNNITVALDDSNRSFVGPSWSPDGATIVMRGRDSTGTTPANGGIYTVTAAASQTPTQIIADNGSQTNNFPDWKPDGTKIAFYRDTGNTSTSGLFTADPNGSGATQLLVSSSFPGGAVRCHGA